ncbi:MAG: LacI family transcriptional regulator [Actinomycetales bacterium]|nr:LacI family transcriptional regulator [Actinomycetales bacterium]
MHRPTIGYIAPATGGFFFGALLAGVVRATAEVGGLVVAVQTVEAQTEGVDEVALRALEGFSIEVGWSRCDAFLCAAEAVGGAYLRRLLASGRPVVSICKEHEGISCPSVMPDNRDGVRRAVAHLVAHGHRRIGFVGNLVQSDMRQRFTGYRQALVEHGIPVDPALHFESSDNMSLGGESAARAILAAGVPTTALVVATDRNAIALMRTLREAGLSLPGDQAVIGFDDVDEGAQLDPALTTVNPGFDRLGELAARCALRMVAGERVEPGQHTAGASLVIRQSCGCRNPIIRTSDPDPRVVLLRGSGS